MSDPIVTYIYASQTGNAEEISMTLLDDTQAKGFTAERYEFNEHFDQFDLTKTTPKRV